ncbi:MAG: phosphate signaling complex protein PhoU [Clostridia bacterium]|nr:phosphate signaling complex protein PhoU [Clostridia bacterium]
MRNRFEEQLNELNKHITVMGALCENSIALAVKALFTGDENYAKKAIEVDKEIDEEEKIIEQLCLRLLLQQQPVAKDLRIISAALKMITDLERIGDQASDIAELAKYIKKTDYTNYPNIKKMSEEAVKMVTDSINSFVKSDLKLVQEVINHDDIVDALFCNIKNDIMELLRNDSFDSEEVIDILMVAKYLERIADHATNIAEWVEFSITGTHKEE